MASWQTQNWWRESKQPLNLLDFQLGVFFSAGPKDILENDDLFDHPKNGGHLWSLGHLTPEKVKNKVN